MRKDKSKYIYVLEYQKNCFKEEKELSKYGKVTRISGETPTENSRLRSLSLKMKNKIWLGIHKTWSRFIICFK